MKNKLNQLFGYLNSRASSFIFLFSFFCLAFVFSPYWILPKSRTFGFLLLLFILIAGGFWALASAGLLKGKITKKDISQFLIFLISVLIINFLALKSSIPWRGDEQTHINRTLDLIALVHPGWIVGGFFIFSLLLILVINKPRVGIWLWIFVLLFIGFYFIYRKPINMNNIVDGGFILRRQFVNFWLISFLPALGSFFNHLYFEPFYRVIPFLSVTGIIWVFSEELRKTNFLIAWLWGITIATIPLAFYYSSILYLEMPAVFLMSVVLTRIDTLVFADRISIKNCWGWLALILIGFIKETALIFLFGFLFFRWWFHLIRRNVCFSNFLNFPKDNLISSLKDKSGYYLGEVNIAFSTSFPALLYLLLRSNVGSISRDYVPSINNLFQLPTYSVLLKSYLDQFGVFFLLFIASIIYLFLRKKKYLAVTFTGFFLILMIFFALDDWKYIGYSRFNLFLLPIVLVASTDLIAFLANKSRLVSILIFFLIVANLLLSPILLDGTKKPYWGDYNYNTSEQYYPYAEVLSYIKETRPDSRIFFADAWRQYFVEFYFSKLNWFPKYEFMRSGPNELWVPKENNRNGLNFILLSASNKGYDTVIYHVLGKYIPNINAPFESYKEKLFCNMVHCLVLFYK